MIRIDNLSVMDQFSDTIPKAAAYDELYLRTVAEGVQNVDPPVTMRIDTVGSGGFRAEQIRALIVEPIKPRLHPYKMCHYATAAPGRPNAPGLLNVGWYLVGGDRANGRSMGIFNVGAATEFDVNEITSIVETIHTYAVVPAIQHIATLALGGDQEGQGFFGV